MEEREVEPVPEILELEALKALRSLAGQGDRRRGGGIEDDPDRASLLCKLSIAGLATQCAAIAVFREHAVKLLAVLQRACGLQEQGRSEEHTSELQSPCNLVCRLLLEKKNVSRSSVAVSQHICGHVAVV